MIISTLQMTLNPVRLHQHTKTCVTKAKKGTGYYQYESKRQDISMKGCSLSKRKNDKTHKHEQYNCSKERDYLWISYTKG